MTNEDRAKVEKIRRRKKNNSSKARTETDKERQVVPEVHDVHDNFFKELMQQPGNAMRFLRERLPEELAGLLGPEPPEVLPGSFVKQLHPSHTDLLLKVVLTDGCPLLIHLVLEHKSYPEPSARLQLASYVVDVLERWQVEHPRSAVPPVVPVLVYNGTRRWSYSTELADLAGEVPVVVRKHMLSLEHVLVDLSAIEDDALSGDPHLRIILRVERLALSDTGSALV